ncbi:hypothetical protein IEQ34_014951 [Dendrobium chrysotoxum]|uniref:DUF4283 domain-containing protein n=1 Tax=Dendrobium chrysotoxum TaxID=161865 RepID=A0AAV7GN11_DENCH|nr:hypothetical protein IEQ34_014951 [Dendrobium chrysotoxum]
MKLMKWSSEFDIAEESPSILIWVSFPNTHPYLFARHILHGLGSIFGRPLRCDNVTSIGARLSITCVLVELDISKNIRILCGLIYRNLAISKKEDVDGNLGANTCMVDSSMAMENGTSLVVVDLNLMHKDDGENQNVYKLDTDPKEIGLVLSHEKLDVVNMVLCDVNTVVLNDFSSDLDVYSGDLDVYYGGSLLDSTVSILSPNVNGEVPFMDVPFIISNDDLKVQLGLSMKDPFMY